MKRLTPSSRIVCALLVVTSATALPARRAGAGEIEVHRRTLPNGVRTCYLHHAKATGVSIFTFLPMGLCADDAGGTQWAHLIEHLVIRTTAPGQLRTVNAETLADHMRLDFYGAAPAELAEGLSHHARWLRGLPFTAESLRAEPGRANAEVDHTAAGMFTHKFATAAWNQVYRHGQRDVALKGDLVAARGEDLTRYRDARLFLPRETLVCVIGAETPAVVLDAVANAAGDIEPPAAREGVGPVKKFEPHAGNHRATWDVDARHLLMTWPTVSVSDDPAAFAALTVVARLAWMNAAQDRGLSKHLTNVMAGHDLRTPEATHLYVSGALPAGADAAAAGTLVAGHLARLKESAKLRAMLPLVTAQLLAEIDPQDLTALRRQAPKQLTDAMVEAQVALTWATAEYRLGESKAAYQEALGKLTAEQVADAVNRFLTPDRLTVVELGPRDAER